MLVLYHIQKAIIHAIRKGQFDWPKNVKLSEDCKSRDIPFVYINNHNGDNCMSGNYFENQPSHHALEPISKIYSIT